MNLLQEGKINFLLDIGAGSSAKGQVASAIALREKPDILISTSATSASHTFTGFGETFVFKVLPTASALNRFFDDYNPTIFISPSAGFELEQLKKEIEWCKLKPEQVVISARSFVVEEGHKIRENEKMNGGVRMEGGVTHLGSTSSGQSSAFYDKISRDKTYRWVGERKEIVFGGFALVKDYPQYSELLASMLDEGQTALLEMPQGYMLSIDYSPNMKKSTFRNINPLQALADMGLNIGYYGKIIGNIRVFPIRVSNRFENNSIENVVVEVSVPTEDGKGRKIIIASAVELGLDYDDLNSVVNEVAKGNSTKIYGKDIIIRKFVKGFVGSSGDFMKDEMEVSWKMLKETINPEIEPELTTLTKLPRRIAIPVNGLVSLELMRRAYLTIKPDYLSMTFLNYAGFKNPNDPKFVDFHQRLNSVFNREISKDFKLALAQFGKDILDVYYVNS